MPNLDRESFDLTVASLLPSFGIQVEDIGISNFKSAMEGAWNSQLNPHEAALAAAYAYLDLIGPKDPVKCLLVHGGKVIPVQEQWSLQGYIREEVILALELALDSSETSTDDMLISNQSTVETELAEPFPFRPDLPDVTKCEPVRAFKLGKYLIMMVKDAPTVAERLASFPKILSYPLVLVVTEETTGFFPVFYVTLERGASGKTFLCTFDKNGGRSNYGPGPTEKDETAFIAQAMAVIRKELKVSGEPKEIGGATNQNKGCLGVIALLAFVPIVALVVRYYA